MSFKEKLMKAGVIKKGHFRLTSGKHSDTYINKDAIYSNPELFEEAAYRLERLAPFFASNPDYENRSTSRFHVITGPAIAGAVLAAPIALRTGKIFVYPEKVYHPYTTYDREGHDWHHDKWVMELRRGYDKVVAGKKVLLIEDIITTGKNVTETIQCIHEADSKVVEVRCIWNRSGEKRLHVIEHETCFGDSTEAVERFIDIISIINEPVESWESDECPLCKDRSCPHCECNGSGMATNEDGDMIECQVCDGTGVILLTDPKTGEAV